MDYFPYTADGANGLPYSYAQHQYDIQPGRDNSAHNSPSSFDLAFLFGLSSLFNNINPPVTSTELVTPSISLVASSSTVAVAHHLYHPFSTTTRHNAKLHPCQQCDKVYHRRALAEGCENRHQNLRPFHCEKRCGDPNW
jgi:hypothetical protein